MAGSKRAWQARGLAMTPSRAPSVPGVLGPRMPRTNQYDAPPRWVSAAYAAMLALYHRDMHDGPGQMIDVAIIEPILHLMGAQATIYDQLGKVQGRTGNTTTNLEKANAFS